MSFHYLTDGRRASIRHAVTKWIKAGYTRNDIVEGVEAAYFEVPHMPDVVVWQAGDYAGLLFDEITGRLG